MIVILILSIDHHIIIVIIHLMLIVVIMTIVIIIVIAFNNFKFTLMEFRAMKMLVDRMLLVVVWYSFELVIEYIGTQLFNLCIKVVEIFVIVTVN